MYAALYTLPYLTNGLQLNSFVLLSIAAGIAHVQVGVPETLLLEWPGCWLSCDEEWHLATWRSTVPDTCGVRNGA